VDFTVLLPRSQADLLAGLILGCNQPQDDIWGFA
jgi:hypothetical protein